MVGAMRAREWPGPVRLSDPFEELFVGGVGAVVPDDARCLDRLPGVPGWQKPKFDASLPITPGGLSEKVGIFVSELPEPSKIAFAVQNATDGKLAPILRDEGIAMADLLSFALFRARRGPGNAGAFVAAVRTAIKSYRHQWAVSGGNGGSAAMGRGPGFVGHLEDCLRRGLLS